jgi:hypothetical protein
VIHLQLVQKVNAFTPLFQLRSGARFTLGAKQQKGFDEIKNYLTSPSVLQAPKKVVFHSGFILWLRKV